QRTLEGSLYAANSRLAQKAVQWLDAEGDALGRRTRTFQSRFAFFLPTERPSGGGKQIVPRPKLRQNQALHPPLSLRCAQPGRIVRYEAVCSCGESRRAESDSLQPARA